MSEHIYTDPSPFMGAPADPEMMPCPDCDGEGSVPCVCEFCGGGGWAYEYEPGGYLWHGCQNCGGDGEQEPGTGADRHGCRTCRGNGKVVADYGDRP